MSNQLPAPGEYNWGPALQQANFGFCPFPPPNFSQPPPSFNIPPPPLVDGKPISSMHPFQSNTAPYFNPINNSYSQCPYSFKPVLNHGGYYTPSYPPVPSVNGTGCPWNDRNQYQNSGNPPISDWKQQDRQELSRKRLDSDRKDGDPRRDISRSRESERRESRDRESLRRFPASRKRSRSPELYSRSSKSRYSSRRDDYRSRDRDRGDRDRERGDRDRERYSKAPSRTRDRSHEFEDSSARSSRDTRRNGETSRLREDHNSKISRVPRARSTSRKRSRSQESHSSKSSALPVVVPSKPRILSERELLLEKYRRHYCATSKDMERRMDELSAIGTEGILENERKVWTRTAPADLYYSRDESNPRIMKGTPKLRELCEIFKHFLLDRAKMARASQVSNLYYFKYFVEPLPRLLIFVYILISHREKFVRGKILKKMDKCLHYFFK